ncbi:hypothetical protein GCM10008019_36590 [Deinococcus soli (ex Cha et al. 2016)]|nr:hypothetical protein GCM10008019_36590 [Deinococcus soli (ex Cha et al. 2016)]
MRPAGERERLDTGPTLTPVLASPGKAACPDSPLRLPRFLRPPSWRGVTVHVQPGRIPVFCSDPKFQGDVRVHVSRGGARPQSSEPSQQSLGQGALR